MQHQSLAIIAFSCVLAGSALSQTGTPGAPVPRLHGPEKQASLAAARGDTGAPKGNPDAVALDQAVITLKDGCKPIGDIAPSKDCISEVTKAQFEKLTAALQPGMNWDSKRAFAGNYGKLLVYADAARALNLENNPDVMQILQFVTNQVLAEALKRHYSDEYAHPSDQQIEDYYKQNSAKYMEANLQRIIIPHMPGTPEKPAPSDTDQAAAAEKIRQQWIAGGDASKLQQSAYELAGVTGAGSPDVTLGNRQPGSLPLNQEAVFKLKAGDVSQVFSDPAAYYIYKVVSVREIPVSEVRDSIIKTLQQRQMQDKLDEIGKSATPVLNETYFGPVPVPGGPMPGARPGPAGAPQASNPPK
jgi:hypothetical protein